MITLEDINNFEIKELTTILKQKNEGYLNFEKKRLRKRSQLLKTVDLELSAIALEFWDLSQKKHLIDEEKRHINQLGYLLKKRTGKQKDTNFQELVEGVRAIPIIRYVHQFRETKKIGNKLICKSLLSNEKTASFHIDEIKNVWYCFSTSQGGDLIKLVMVHQNLNFKNAILFLKDMVDF